MGIDLDLSSDLGKLCDKKSAPGCELVADFCGSLGHIVSIGGPQPRLFHIGQDLDHF